MQRIVNTFLSAIICVLVSLSSAYSGYVEVDDETGCTAFLGSAVDGTAFFWPVGVDLTSWQTGAYRLTLHDSTAKTAVGWIQAATPAGETLAGELLSNPSFDSGTTGYTAVGAGAALASIAGGQVNNCLQVTEGGGANPYANTVPTLQAIGSLMKISSYVKSGTSSTYRVYVFATGPAAAYPNASDLTSTGSWVQINRYFTIPLLTTKTDFILRNMCTASSAKTHLFDEASFQKVTDPPSTGARIVSNPHGSTRNWASITASFNWNAVTSFEVERWNTNPTGIKTQGGSGVWKSGSRSGWLNQN